MSNWHRHLPEQLHPSEIELGVGETLPAVWVSNWQNHPERNVIHDPALGWISAGDLLDRSEVIARRLANVGVELGDRVLLSAASSVELVAAHTAAFRLGAVVMPTNGAYRADEVTHVVSDARPKVAIVDRPEWSEWIHSCDSTVLVTSPSVEMEEGPSVRLDQIGAGSSALIGYTSGTTGRPKGAVLSHGNLLSSVRALEIAWRWQPQDILILALPLFHMHGLGVGLHGSLAIGAQAVLLPEFEVTDVLDSIKKHHASMFFGVPTMYSRLVESSRAGELSQLRLCVSGSAPLAAALHQRIQEVSGQRVLERYGMTETAMLVSNPYEGERRPGSVGFPLPGVEVLLKGDPPEILVKGPNVFQGYWERPEANSQAFDDGWFRTGDLGALDPDGYLSIVGRAKEMIISGGFNVYPREVEDVISQHEAIRECAVVGEPDEEWGETVVAFVVADRELSLDEIKNFVGERLAHYKRPRRTYRIDSMPRNALGKVQKHRLAEQSIS